MHDETEEIRGQLVFNTRKSGHTTLQDVQQIAASAAWQLSLLHSGFSQVHGILKGISLTQDQSNTTSEKCDSGITSPLLQVDAGWNQMARISSK